jgi:hypothetical protein
VKNKKSSKIKFISTMPKSPGVFPKPEPAYKNIPTWFKKIESFYDGDSTPYAGQQKLTVKRCVAFLDILSSGYFLLAPFDIYIDTTDGKKDFTIPTALQGLQNTHMKQFVGMHDLRQVEGYPFDKDVYVEHLFRIHPIWVVKTDPGVSCLYINPQHQENSPLFAISAVIDTDGYPSDGLLSFLVKKDFKGYIKKGTPIMQVIPFKRQNYESEIVETQNEYNKVKLIGLAVRSVFNSGYKKMFWNKKTYS